MTTFHGSILALKNLMVINTRPFFEEYSIINLLEIENDSQFNLSAEEFE